MGKFCRGLQQAGVENNGRRSARRAMALNMPTWEALVAQTFAGIFLFNELDFEPSGSSTKAMTVVPPFTGPASRVTLPPF
ncbi:Uncharacterised protein [Klebsiella pneumoniae]|uniref:Uncharacterized protein n=1 Tax=Klebsiella pneumoniae TaxID=573 RepID=A0A377WJ16_KLEPN|nr:Uncharacterised protein [Klebsiella pneumoniae]